MQISTKAQEIKESVTLKLNARAGALAAEGKKIYNLTAGQLPFRPTGTFTELMEKELSFIKSYQYSPVPGLLELRKKLLEHFQESRNVEIDENEFDCIVSNGGKHVLANIFAALLNPGDEVILLAPYWISYPEMVKLNGGVAKSVTSTMLDGYTPRIDDIEAQVTDKTKVIVLNSPNNPTGVHYSDEFMQEFAAFLKRHPNLTVIIDEIYYHLYYYDPKPTYFYQHDPSLLSRTLVVDGISKTLACTGLRIGFCIGPKEFVKAMSRVQGQTASGANSLVQRALAEFDFHEIEEYLKPIKVHLQANAEYIKNKYKEEGFSHNWYQSTSAFYYFIDFSKLPIIEKFSCDGKKDCSAEICEALLNETGVAIVPGGDFGAVNSARISLVSEQELFQEAVDKMFKFLLCL